MKGLLAQVFLYLVIIVGSVKGLQYGTFRIGRTSPDSYYCDDINFQKTFSGVGSVKVFTSVGFGTSSTRVHDVVFTWIESVTTSGFKVCLVESGTGSNGNVTINWIAYQGAESGVDDGSVRFNEWTTETQCRRVPLSRTFSRKPHVFVTALHNVLDRKQDATTVWVRDITRDVFTVCMREGRSFDGRHKDIEVIWMAMNEVPHTWNSDRDLITMDFPSSLTPTEADNDAICQVINFKEPYYSPPIIVLTPRSLYDSNESSISSTPSSCNSISAWVEETTNFHFKACVKSLNGLSKKWHPIQVEYLVFGDLDPCINKTCEYFGVCKAMSASLGQCVCVTQCPPFQDLVCASNGQTFDNMCAMKREICQTNGNYSYYHPGSCHGFPLDKGRTTLNKVSSFSESHCEVVTFKPYTFYPKKPIHVQLTVNYINTSFPAQIHEATVVWSENVNLENYTVCITKTGRNDKQTNDVASVHWIAYQGSPNGAVTGKEAIAKWGSGTKCKTLSFPNGKFSQPPRVLVTLDHKRLGLKRDAAIVWAENITSASFQVCARELQNFDGVHEEIEVDWLAYEALHYPLFSEHGSVYFLNDYLPLKSNNYAFCKNVSMERNYTTPPLVMITATHTTVAGSIKPKCNGISAWIEDISITMFRVCLQELFSERYDPVTVQYAVLADVCGEEWTYFNGFCYKTNSSCLSWQSAQSSCLANDANLTTITSQEENTYVQHRHAGGTGWIGLQDINSEGNFTWIDGTSVNFTYWAQNQPNGYPGDQDCVHTLGLRHDYHWNDVSCASCHPYTCRREIDECLTSDVCHANAKCINTHGAFNCECKPGFIGNGFQCTAMGPPKSCLEILQRKKSHGTGDQYWIDPSNSGVSFQVSCDMDTDGGGWTLVSNYVIPSSGSMPSLDVIYSYANIGRYGNQRMVISSGALRKLQAMTSFTQLRWQCRKSSVGRTIDVMTSKNALGYATVNYFMSTYSPRPDICGSYYSGPDDTSLTSQQKCSDWCYIGKWSHSGWEDKYYKVYDHPFYVAGNYHFIIRPGPRLECDDYIGGVSPGDFWKIYVR